ncbi:MAG: protein phosphatase 2C domain-containing protein [Fuerstiella sp.]
MSDSPVVQYASRTDVGMRRAANQDSLAVRFCSDYGEWHRCGHLFAVADGMGGHSVGDLASRISVDTLPLAYFKADVESIPERLLAAITAANRAINVKARENPEFADMGTTCSSLALSPVGAFVGHVGDSRVYRVRDGQIQQLSFDHSLQWEMVRQGRATIENVDMLHPRNVITRCLGPDQNVNIDIEGPFHVQAGDRFIICSDGLTGHLTDTEIGAITASLSPADAARLLINLANCRGGADNVTVVVANVEEYPPLTGTFVDSKATSKTEPAGGTNKRKSKLISQISLIVFLVLATVGLGFLAFGRISQGLILVCPAVILGFVRLIFLNHRPAEDPADTDSLAPDGGLPAASPPYRTASAKIDSRLLEFLAEAQSELTQAARDNGWKVDMDRLADLNRRALAALKQKKPAECIRFRARAIDDLMKELYAHTRRS